MRVEYDIDELVLQAYLAQVTRADWNLTNKPLIDLGGSESHKDKQDFIDAGIEIEDQGGSDTESQGSLKSVPYVPKAGDSMMEEDIEDDRNWVATGYEVSRKSYSTRSKTAEQTVFDQLRWDT